MNTFVVFLCFAVTIAAVSACEKNGNFDASCPADAKLFELDNSMKQLIVDAHNDKRNFIAGGGESKLRPACRMATMRWDDGLAAEAVFNVKQCKEAPDNCHNTEEFHNSGQNVGWIAWSEGMNKTQLLSEMVNYMWYSKVSYARQAYMEFYQNDYYGNEMRRFAQMMVDRNILVGCAVSTYAASNNPFNVFLVACNYATTVKEKKPVYVSCDKAAEKCRYGTNSQYPNLCSTSEDYEINNW